MDGPSTSKQDDNYKFSSLVSEFDIAKFLTKNGKGDYLGCGSFGAVRRCCHGDFGTVVVKCFNLTGTKEQQDKILKGVSREANVLSTLHHDNIVQLLGITRWATCIGIVMEYVDGGTLSDLIFNKEIRHIDWAVRLRIIQHITSVLELLHNYGPRKFVCHGDLKTDNVLLTSDLSAKVADFGSANIVKATGATAASYDLAPTTQHTQWYAAPELLSDVTRERTPAMDMYSLAMILYEMASRRRVYDGANAPYYVIINGIQCGFLRPELSRLDDEKPTTLVDTQIFDFFHRNMVKCWDKAPEKRATSGEILSEMRQVLKKCDGSKMFLERKKLWKEVQGLRDANGTKEEESHQEDVCLQEFSFPFLSVGTTNSAPSTQKLSKEIKEKLSTISVPKSTKEEEKYAETISTCLGEFENDEDSERLLKLSEAVRLRLKVHLPVKSRDTIAPRCLEVAGMLAVKLYYEQACEFIEYALEMFDGLTQNGEARLDFCMEAFKVCYFMAKSGMKYLKEEYTRVYVLPLMQTVCTYFEDIRYADLDDMMLAKVHCWVRCMAMGLRFGETTMGFTAADATLDVLVEAYMEGERQKNQTMLIKLLTKVEEKLTKFNARQFFLDAMDAYEIKAGPTRNAEIVVSIRAMLLKLFEGKTNASDEVTDPEFEQIAAILQREEAAKKASVQKPPKQNKYTIPNLSEDMQMAAAIQASLQYSQTEKLYREPVEEGKTPTEEQRLLKFFEEVDRQPEDVVRDIPVAQPIRAPILEDISSLSEEEQLRRAIEESLKLSQPQGEPVDACVFEMPFVEDKEIDAAEQFVNVSENVAESTEQNSDEVRLGVAKEVIDDMLDQILAPPDGQSFPKPSDRPSIHPSGAVTSP